MCWFKFVFLIRVLELVNHYFLTITSDVLIFFLSSIFLICGFQGTMHNWIFSALNIYIHKLVNILLYSVPAHDRRNLFLRCIVQKHCLTVLSVIRNLSTWWGFQPKIFKSLITGKPSYHNSTSLLIGLALISCCSSLPVSIWMSRRFRFSFL